MATAEKSDDTTTVRCCICGRELPYHEPEAVKVPTWYLCSACHAQEVKPHAHP
jgi:hypothetical protein